MHEQPVEVEHVVTALNVVGSFSSAVLDREAVSQVTG